MNQKPVCPDETGRTMSCDIKKKLIAEEKWIIVVHSASAIHTVNKLVPVANEWLMLMPQRVSASDQNQPEVDENPELMAN